MMLVSYWLKFAHSRAFDKVSAILSSSDVMRDHSGLHWELRFYSTKIQ